MHTNTEDFLNRLSPQESLAAYQSGRDILELGRSAKKEESHVVLEKTYAELGAFLGQDVAITQKEVVTGVIQPHDTIIIGFGSYIRGAGYEEHIQDTLSTLGLSNRCQNFFQKNNLRTIGELLEYMCKEWEDRKVSRGGHSTYTFYGPRNLGDGSMNEIVVALLFLEVFDAIESGRMRKHNRKMEHKILKRLVKEEYERSIGKE